MVSVSDLQGAGSPPVQGLQMTAIGQVAGAAASPMRPAVGSPGPLARLWGSRGLIALRSFAIFIGLWYLLHLWNDNPIQLPSPLRVLAALSDLTLSGEVPEHALVSTARLLVSLGVAVLLAIPLGFWMGMSQRVNAFIDPLVELLRPISGIAWIPLGLFIFGVGDTLPVFIMVYVAFFPLLLNTIAGVRNVDRQLYSAARTMGLSRASMLRRVVLPSALPTIMVGFRLAFAGAWAAIVAAELIGAPNGLGFAIEWYRQLLMSAKVFSFVAVIGLVGYLCDLGLRALQRWLTPWAQGRGAATSARSLASSTAKRSGVIFSALLLPVLLVLAWQAWAAFLASDARAPAPAQVISTFITLTSSGDLPMATFQSLVRVLLGFTVALVLGVGLGVLMGSSRKLQDNFDPIVESFRPIAPMAMLPIAILWFGTGTAAAVAIVAYAAFFPVVLNTIHGVQGVDRRMVEAARTMGVARPRILASVMLPAALPSVLLGARLAMGVAWTAIIAAELAVGAKSGGGTSGGIGQMMFVFYAYSIDLNGIVVCMIVVGAVALLIDRLFRALERRLMPWRT